MDTAISVIIPVYNSEKFIGAAIESVLNQSHPAQEIIVVDDGSTDNTAAIIDSYKAEGLRYIYQEHAGKPSITRNHALSLATGDIIAFLDGDDLWTPDTLAIQMRYMQEDPTREVVIGTVQAICEPGFKMADIAALLKDPKIFLVLSSLICKKTVFDKIGGFDETMTFLEDVDWFMRLKKNAINMHTHDDLVHYYRLHSTNISNQLRIGFSEKQVVKIGLLQIIKKHLGRQYDVITIDKK